MPESSQAIASRCLVDVVYVRLVLAGGIDADVRSAILADLAAAPEVRRALCPASTATSMPDGRDAGAEGWLALPRPALSALASEPPPR